MKTDGQITVAYDDHLFVDTAIKSQNLYQRRLFKILSLLETDRAGVSVPQTLLLLQNSINVLKNIAKDWGLPLMIRLDYAHLPKNKFLGGIPLESVEVAEKVGAFLLESECYPIFHPNMDRFHDIYSAGVLLNRRDSFAKFEIVGTGFDAGDLRRGMAVPHESFACDLEGERIDDRRFISPSTYSKERMARQRRISYWNRYTTYANTDCRLVATLDRFKSKIQTQPLMGVKIPEAYLPLQQKYLRQLVQNSWMIRATVLEKLPPSTEYVASFSFIPDRGWILWDIYGEWYKR